MKKSFDESIQWMREQNWIKSWLRSVGYDSLDNAHLVQKMKARYDVMEQRNAGCSIILGVNNCVFDSAAGRKYSESIRTTMHKWMFNY
jgi:hypothetical protein